MRYTIENSFLKIAVDSHGAELRSAVDCATGLEYMWQADPAYWNRTSPVLFPFVGSLKNKQYRYDGKVWKMGQHGFARDMEFTLISSDDTSLLFSLSSNAESYAKYPFNFTLEIGYKLNGRSLSIGWKVTNDDDTTMYFSIGAHPAFRCPLNGEADKSGYRLFFKDISELKHYGNFNANGYADEADLHVLALTDGQAVITKDFFDRCTYIADGHQTGGVGIMTPAGEPYITVDFDTPLFGIWSPEKKNAPFLCIEPWFGRADGVDFEGTLQERTHGNTLGGHEHFQTEYSITFGAVSK